MSKFLKKLCLIFSTLTITIMSVYLIFMCLNINISKTSNQVFYVINKAAYNSGRSAVILGDSVCNSIWPQYEDDNYFSHLGSNKGITACGNYLLLKRYLENNPQTREAYYLMSPFSFETDLYDIYTYGSFVIPFLNDENMKFLEPETIEKLYQRFGKIFITSRYVKNFLLNNNFLMQKYLDYIMTKQGNDYQRRLSQTAVIYLTKMHELCREHNVKFFVYPLPVKDIPENHDWENFKQDVKNYGLEEVLGNFIERILYYPEDWFEDEIHLTRSVLEYHRDEIIAAILKSPEE